jgi:hypothetical protein
MTPQGNALSALGGAKQVEGLGQWPLHAQRLEEEDALLPSSQLHLRRRRRRQ